MKKRIKKITAILLCLLIITGTVISDNVHAKATTLPVISGVTSALKAVVGTGIAYAGYKATKRQVESITSTTAGLLNDYSVVAKKAKKENVITKSAYITWVSSGWLNHPYRNALIAFTERVYDNVIDDIQETWLNEHAEDEVDIDELKLAWLKEHAEELEGLTEDEEEEITTEEPVTEEPTTGNSSGNNNKMPKCVPWIIGSVGAQAGVQVALSLGFNKNMSKLVSDIIKKDFNSEYEKTKSKYDWESLGFKTDYDVLETVDYNYVNSLSYDSNSMESSLKDKTSLVFTTNTDVMGWKNHIFQFEKINSNQFGTDENFALVSLRDYKTEMWNTYFVSEFYLFNKFTELKNNYITYDDFLKSLYFNSSDMRITRYQALASGGFKKGYSKDATDYKYIGSSSPFTIEFDYGTDFSYSGKTISLLGSAKIVNPSKTMNYFLINFTNESTLQASCSTENGTIQPIIKKSVYTNTADEIDKKKDIIIDTNKNYDDTDSQIADIALDNDLDLKVIEDNTEEITDNTKGIWESIKGLPRQIYNFFSGILEKILKAVKASPLSIWNYFKNPMSQLIKGVNTIADQSGLEIHIPDFSSINAVLNTIEHNVNHSRNFIEDIQSLLRQFLLNFQDSYKIFNIQDILNKIPSASSISKSIKGVLIDIFIPDIPTINNAIDDLKGNFEFINDFTAIVKSIINTAIEPHDYITIYNWNKEGNKYDKRDSYRIYFTWYSPYRPYVNAIIIAFVYLIFVWRIFIKLPSIINGTGGGIETVNNITVHDNKT